MIQIKYIKSGYKQIAIVVSLTIIAMLAALFLASTIYDRLVYCPRDAASEELLRQVVLVDPRDRTAQLVRIDLQFNGRGTSHRATLNNQEQIESFLSSLHTRDEWLLDSKTDNWYFDSLSIQAWVTDVSGTQAEVFFMRDGFLILAGRICTGENISTRGDSAVLWIYEYFGMDYPRK